MAKLQITTDYIWGPVWPRGYLALAEQGLLLLRSQRNLGKNRTKIAGHLLLSYSHKKAGMIIAALFNIKHATELILKALGMRLAPNYWLTHDLDYLFTDLEQRGIENSTIRVHTRKLKKLVDKYYLCEFHPSVKLPFRDTDNIYFKYPVNKVEDSKGVYIEHITDYKFINALKRKDLNQFLKDIHNLNRLYDVLDSEIASFQAAAKLGIAPEDHAKELRRVPTIKDIELK